MFVLHLQFVCTYKLTICDFNNCEIVISVLQKAGRHMEHTLIAAYVVLLLGYLIMDNKVKKNTYYGKAYLIISGV